METDNQNLEGCYYQIINGEIRAIINKEGIVHISEKIIPEPTILCMVLDGCKFIVNEGTSFFPVDSLLKALPKDSREANLVWKYKQKIEKDFKGMF